MRFVEDIKAFIKSTSRTFDEIIEELRKIKKILIRINSGTEIEIYDGMDMTTDDSLTVAEAFLEEGYEEIDSGMFLSEDGSRRVRFTDSDLQPQSHHAEGRSHMNFEVGKTIKYPGRKEPTFEVAVNMHIYLID